ncbi:hypothetical protein HPB49_004587 [Dermacentor silvarum]|uniref:Uncharacterized protein n=1 Tax=Dermacentor silvarum TaxID=543639 RepID=A0ACB8DB25_DERSI|nr:hypothetical protein HPB49_004587 [Dermacentor silvarum]
MLSQTYCDALLKFTIRMYQLLQSKNAENENVVCSAFSVACSLAMLAGGAGGSTSKQIFALLSLKASKDRIREHFSNLLTMLSGCAPDATFLVANRLYSDKRFPVQSGYVVLLESSYGATLKSVDFSSSHEVVRREANAWIKEQTASKVQDMLRPGSVDSRTVLETLKDLGVKDLFTPGKADLSGIFESGRPAVSEVIHKAAVEVYEEGTEPAASTTVVIESTGTIAAQAVRFVVDHPFMFLIKSNEPEVILFMGSVRKL